MNEIRSTSHNTHTPNWTLILGIGGAIIGLGLLLLLDLQFQGLAWRVFWQTTGEEEPIGQIRGMVEWAGNGLRPQPQTAPHTPIQHTDIAPFGVNTFLQLEAAPAKREAQVRMISEAGFTSIRQEFPWEDIEIDGRGQFTDSRNDLDGDGTPDTIDAWQKYDQIVDLSEQYDLDLLVRLSNPPEWAQTPDLGDMSPPTDVQDFVNYAVAVAERYQGRIRYYQIWNEPNIYPEWGAQAPNPIAYTDLLCQTYDALKAVDPSIVVISGTIAPTKSLDGFNYQDLVYLNNMYNAGAGDCFDVLSAQGYGLNSGPTDRRVRFDHFSYARHVLYRDVMVQRGDAHKPIWLSEVSWNHVLDADLPPEQITGYGNFGLTTQAQAARYVPLAYQRALQEWPWIGHLSYWHFTVETHERAHQVFYYFRMVEPDYSPQNPTFTPLPIYDAMQAYLTDTRNLPTLYRGVHQAESWEIGTDNDAGMRPVADAAAQFGQALQASTNVYFNTHGTAISVRVQTDAPLTVVKDGTFILDSIPARAGWQTVMIDSAFIAGDHTYILESDTPFLIDAVIIRQDMWRNIALVVGVVVLVKLGLVLGLWQWRRRRINRPPLDKTPPPRA
jgi:polysaccharide biosynthesis protein PslG